MVAAFKRGDRAALTTVFRTYVHDVARQVRASRIAAHEVEAMVQEVFAKAFTEDARARWDGIRPYGAWLNTLTRNAMIDRARKERRLDFRAPDDMPDVVDDRASPADDVDAHELATVLARFEADLTDDERAVFARRFQEGLSLSVSAKALGWSEIKVRTVDTRLRARLLQDAQDAGFFARVRVRIGASLLARRSRKSGARVSTHAPEGV